MEDIAMDDVAIGLISILWMEFPRIFFTSPFVLATDQYRNPLAPWYEQSSTTAHASQQRVNPFMRVGESSPISDMQVGILFSPDDAEIPTYTGWPNYPTFLTVLHRRKSTFDVFSLCQSEVNYERNSDI
ncbi:Protein of unknown function [Pyronema omphalodes CBS 100304]|uniref:Uncharacterized protein n=1 Tax=Pyronema omphalodes (strain CBS 100304) TaxID=1076935 RepID=U4LI56_PYROM|nr:Protein of unknown function [Pyronema omphalodes CBS 100304]